MGKAICVMGHQEIGHYINTARRKPQSGALMPVDGLQHNGG